MTKFREPIKGKDPDFKIMPSRTENFWVDRFEQIKSINPNFEMTTDDENMRKSSIINLKCKTCGFSENLRLQSLWINKDRQCKGCKIQNDRLKFKEIQANNPNFEMTADDYVLENSTKINIKCKTCGNTNQIKFISLLLTPNRKCIYCEKKLIV